MRPEDRLYISTVCVQGDRALDQILARMDRLGLRRCELSAPHPYIAPDELSALLEGWRARGFAFVLHNYFPRPQRDFVLNLASADPQVVADCEAMAAWAFDLAVRLDAPLYGMHTGYFADAGVEANGSFSFDDATLSTPEASLARSVATVRRILAATPALPPRGLLLENLFPSGRGLNYSLACTPEDIDAVFDAIADDRVGLLLDLAHLRVTCTLVDRDPDAALDRIIDRHGHRLRAIHMSDNDGLTDSHQPVGEGSWTLSALSRVCQSGAAADALVTLESRRLDDDPLMKQYHLLLRAMS